MDSLKGLLAVIAETQVNSQTYVYYDSETGKIEKIGGKSDPGKFSYITVDHKIVDPILKGEKSLEDFVVDYDMTKQKLSVKEIKTPETEDERSLITFKQIPKKQKTRKIDVLIQQDIKNKTWMIELSDNIKENLRKESVYIRSNLFFSITKKDDPNILYRTINVPIGELVKDKIFVSFETNEELDSAGLSVYTSKYFEIYKHEVLE
jgi:hypothetical protein